MRTLFPQLRLTGCEVRDHVTSSLSVTMTNFVWMEEETDFVFFFQVIEKNIIVMSFCTSHCSMETTTSCNFTLSNVFQENHFYFAKNWSQVTLPLFCLHERRAAVAARQVTPSWSTGLRPFTRQRVALNQHKVCTCPALLWLFAFPLVVSFLSNLLQPHANRLPLNATRLLSVGKINA